MSFINHNSQEIYCKIVYVGPPQSGKTTNIQWIYKNTSDQNMDASMMEIPFESSPQSLFDFLPLSIGKIRDFSTRLHLYSIPGDQLFKSTGKIILKGLDGIVFVADSHPEKLNANIDYLNNFKVQLKDEGYDLKKTPLVIQYNKRDLENAEPLSNMRRSLNYYNSPHLEAVAKTGRGVLPTLQTISKTIISLLKGGSL